MGKITLRGPVPKDDPMFSTGSEIITRHESSQSSTNSANDTNGVAQEKSNLVNATETEQDGIGPRRSGASRVVNCQVS
jgi:hypothetical protein